ncbi:MAG: metal-sensing transcriptional repressor [Lachnospiraceae bacterium]|nr:metal-sensing transcriptional repressor [Lachnospiraceae bacterium]
MTEKETKIGAEAARAEAAVGTETTGAVPAADQLTERFSDHQAQGTCCHKTKERSDKEYRDLLNRLSRIEGQVRGIKGMVEKDAYCPDILIQVAAVNAALNSFNKVLLANHIRTCVMQDIRAGKEETIDELVMTLQKLMK